MHLCGEITTYVPFFLSNIFTYYLLITKSHNRLFSDFLRIKSASAPTIWCVFLQQMKRVISNRLVISFLNHGGFGSKLMAKKTMFLTLLLLSLSCRLLYGMSCVQRGLRGRGASQTAALQPLLSFRLYSTVAGNGEQQHACSDSYNDVAVEVDS